MDGPWTVVAFRTVLIPGAFNDPWPRIMAKRFWWNPTGSEPFMNFYGLLEKFFKFPILQILSKFDTFPFCIMSYFDHFRILLEFWNIPFVLGQVLHVIYIAHSKKVIRTLIFHFRFFPFRSCFIYQNYI